MPRCRLFLVTCLAVTLTFALTQRSSAQETTVYEGNQNLPMWGGFSGGDIDTVSLQNGGVHLHIPIASWKQRGGGTLRAYLVYDTPTWGRQATKQIINKQTYYYTAFTYPYQYWFFVSPFSMPGVSAPLESVSCPPRQNGNVNVYRHYTVTDLEGTKHPLNLYYSVGCGNLATSSPTTDGTGMMDNPSALIFKDGTQEFAANNVTTLEDTNGNLIESNPPNSSTDTMNRYLVQTTNGSGYTLYTITDANGIAQNYRVDMTSAAVATNFCGTFNNPPYWVCNEQSATISVPSKLTLPDGQTYQFSWNQNTPGELQAITLPTGAIISYTYAATTSGECMKPPLSGLQTIFTVPYNCRAQVTSRTVTANGVSSTWTYNLAKNSVLDPNGNEQDHYFGYVSVVGPSNVTYYSPNKVEGEVKYYSGTSTTGTLLKDVVRDYTGEINSPDGWVGNVRPVRETTTLDNGLVTKIETDYETFTFPYGGPSLTPSPFTYTRLNPTEKREYAYGNGAPGALLRRTDYTYLHNNNATYANLNIVDRTASVTVYDGSGNLVSQTKYEYDVYNHTGMPAMAASGAVQHDSARGTSYTTRGNRTASSKWLNTNSGWLTSLSQYDDAGNAIASKDPIGNLTQFDYTDSWVSITGTTGGNACAPSSGQGKAYLTKVTNALNQITAHTYYSCSGALGSTTDANSLTTWYVYDIFNREVRSHAPDGGVVTNCFTDTGGTGCSQSAPPFQRVTTKSINAALNEITTAVSDGLGRIVQTQLNSDPQGTVYMDKTYDLVGRVASVSNPYRAGTDPTSSRGTTTFSYDALNRKVQELYPDNSALTTAYCGNSTLVTDPTGKWRRSLTDAFGRLIEVDEPNAIGATVASTGCVGASEPIRITSYSNDAVGNLTQVLQNGSHTRTFTYDSMSRLQTSTNPETGQISYTWDSDGNLATKKDARSITTTYGYDALNRLTSEAYSNGDPSVTIKYDETNCLGLTSCSNIGHRTSMTDGAGSDAWAYEVDKANLRSIHQEKRTINSSPSNITKTTTYYLDLLGNLTQLVYPTGRTVNYTYNSASRPITAADASNGITYVTDWKTPNSGCLSNAVCYTPQGSIYNMSLGQTSSYTGFNLSESFNSRLQPNEIKAGAALDITYNFVDPVTHKNAGHVYGFTNNLNSSRSQAFTYDQLNRIISAGTTATTGNYCWGYQYNYDAWGNMLSQAGWTPTYNACTETVMGAVTADGNNHLTSLNYDASGNTLSDGNYSYTWDAESQLKTAGGVTYTYDGGGRRASKVGSKLYWYGSGGEILSETDAAGNTLNDYVFFSAQRVAMVPVTGGALFYAEDSLGSSRVMVQSNGTLCYDADFTPFGAERAYTNTCAQNYKFEGKERDTETQNDDFGAREYSWRFGRWLSADWSAVPVPVPYANLTNPQTLNLYSMVADDPESFADLDGHVQNPAVPADPTAPCTEANNCGDGYDPLATYAPPSTEEMAQNQSAQSQSAQNEEKSPDPNLPINHTFVLVVENDSGVIMPEMDGRKVEYDLHNAPDSKHPNGTPVDPEIANSSVIHEHNSNKSLSEGSSGHGQFPDNLGPGGNRKDSGTLSNDRYFTLTSGKKEMGVLPIIDRFGRHLVDHIEVHMDAGHPQNNYTVLNGHRGPTDVE